MRITQLTAENVKRLRAVHVTPNGEMVVVGGNNAQGKSSVLDAIEMALGGKTSIPDEPIRRGAESARVVVQLDNSLTITRRFTEKGSYLDVRYADGSKPASPQGMLDGLVDHIAFDPLDWCRKKSADQAKALRDLVGIDFSELDAKRKEAYDARTEATRNAKREAAAAEAIGDVQAPNAPVDVSALVTEMQRRRDANKASTDRLARYQSGARTINDMRSQLQEVENQIAKLQAQAVALRESITRGEAWMATESKELTTIQMQDVADVERQIASSQAVNAAVARKQEREKHLQAAQAAQETVAALTQKIDSIDAAKAKALAEAHWPIPGLGFKDDEVTYKDLPHSQASSAEQMMVAIAIAFSLNPRLPVVLIRDGSLLDQQSLAMVAAEAERRNAQLWIERVGYGDECSVVIEDGMVVRDTLSGVSSEEPAASNVSSMANAQLPA